MSTEARQKKQVVIIGAGPAGLTAGVELLKTKRYAVTVLERDSVVGGLARTVDYKGYKFDIGPHHFITQCPEIEWWWKDLMGSELLEHKRFTRIFYKKKFFYYPLSGLNVIKNLHVWECLKCVLSYVKIRLFPIKNVRSFQDWVTNKFGHRLFSIFFKTYTEKVWGIACDQISSDWAAQRIKGFSMSKAIFYAFFGRWFKKHAPRTLRDEFYYPLHGSGTMWEKVADQISRDKDGVIYLENNIVHIEHDEDRITAVGSGNKKQGVSKMNMHRGDYFFSTMPLQKLINALSPAAPQEVIDAANALVYRGLITVNLVVNKKDMFPDHWIYVHDKDVKLGRIGVMSNFSKKLVSSSNHTTLALEYFEYIGQGLWRYSDEELFELGKQELERLGVARPGEILDGMVLKTPEAYPVYDANYREHLGAVLKYLKRFSNLHLMGRNGMHRYNNQDIAMLSAFKAVEAVSGEKVQETIAEQLAPIYDRSSQHHTAP